MMEIRNEVINKSEKDPDKPKFVTRSLVEVQRAKLEKLMKNPDKPVIIPERPHEKDFSGNVKSFVRNVMGSSAGAGSGEFHVYRHLRRKEYARQKHIQIKTEKEKLDDEYQERIDANRMKAEEKTAKKRAKRLKKKNNAKNKNKTQKMEGKSESEESEASQQSEDDNKDSGDSNSVDKSDQQCKRDEKVKTPDETEATSSDKKDTECNQEMPDQED